MDLRWQAPHVERLKNCYHMLSAFLTYNVKAEKKAKTPFTTLKIQINLQIYQHFFPSSAALQLQNTYFIFTVAL